jgi:hypothetical protein
VVTERGNKTRRGMDREVSEWLKEENALAVRVWTPTKSGWAHPTDLGGRRQPVFWGIFPKCGYPQPLPPSKPNTGQPLKKWLSLAIQWIATEPNIPLE